jgi:hypothetical protein
MIKALILTNNQILITKIEEVPSELGEPDCKLIEPYIINSDGTLSPWLIDISVQQSYMIHSDKILTIIEPKATLIEKYQSLTK